jgi:adenylate kinase family enzyme
MRASTDQAHNVSAVPLRRVIVIGTTSSGKSTLGVRLAEHLGVPFVELDALHWEPGWTPAEREVFRERVQQATAGDGWVVAGNYRTQTRDITWPRAQVVVFLDYSLPLILRRLVIRSWRRWRTKELLWGTNYESFWKHFTSNDSLILWALRTHRLHRRQFDETRQDPQWAQLEFVRLRSPAETERWLEATAPEATTTAAGGYVSS